MFPKINPTTTRAWQELIKHAAEMKSTSLRELFRQEPDRFNNYSLQHGDILFDHSKNIISARTKELLLQLAEECKLKDGIEALFNGSMINETEQRSVLHTALRDSSGDPVVVAGEDIMPGIRSVLKKMKKFCDSVHSGKLRGYTGKRIKYIVNIGIGGSDLGPYMVTEALKPYWVAGMQSYFVSNVDGTHITETLKKVEPERTLFLIASKTFTTQETMTNAFTARAWFLDKAQQKKFVAQHFVALSTNQKAVTEFGIDRNNMFEFWIGWAAVILCGALSDYQSH
jgi:glucose-6-phosphate isomerase